NLLFPQRQPAVRIRGRSSMSTEMLPVPLTRLCDSDYQADVSKAFAQEHRHSLPCLAPVHPPQDHDSFFRCVEMLSRCQFFAKFWKIHLSELLLCCPFFLGGPFLIPAIRIPGALNRIIQHLGDVLLRFLSCYRVKRQRITVSVNPFMARQGWP